ncbi:MAG: OsmC family peroxiredoxin [Zetaproteobacteria bacterium]|nr:MAG: OsmC family peroxiredoxin [Zetaproteobacteria bacterium]
MRMRVSFEQGARFQAECRGHAITIDQPGSNGGSDAGMTPPELMAASLAGCVGYYVARYCQQAGIDTQGLEIGCDWQVGGEPRCIERFVVQVRLPGLPDNRRRAVERVANSCLIHATLHATPDIEVRLEDPA